MLTENQISQLKPTGTLYRKADSDGLAIEVTPKGKKLWRFRFRWAGRAQMMSLGPYPEISLDDARLRRSEAKRLLAHGQNPIQVKRDHAAKVEAEANANFPRFARQWLAERKLEVAPRTFEKMDAIINGDLIPSLRNTSISTLGSPEAVAVLKKIAGRAPHMALKAQGYLTQMVENAIQLGLREDGKTLSLRRVVRLPKSVSVPAAATEAALAVVLKAVDAYEGDVVRAALQFAALTTMRPANVVEARWEHIDLEARTWTVPASQMKNREQHTVPLPRQAISILDEAKRWKRAGGWVFPAVAKQGTPHLHRDSLSLALREMGMQGKHVPHGFRSSFRTIAREEFEIDIDILEAQIAHVKKGAINRAYDRTGFLKKRVVVMQKWADRLDELRK